MSDASSGSSIIRTTAFADIPGEISLTRKAIERIPADRMDWRPHERSMTVGELATHMVNLLSWAQSALTADGYDMAETPESARDVPPLAELLERFDRETEALIEVLEGVSDAALGEPWTLRHGEHVVFTMPRSAVLRSACLSHVIHHRGQLTVDLRLMGESVPSIYGPSADEEA